MIKLSNVSGGYGKENVIHSLNMEVNQGEIFGILGPNGSGKTTLLKLLSGQLESSKGSIYIKDQMLSQYKSKELARIVAVLPQVYETSFSYSVKETVALGRYAYQSGLFSTWSAEDEQAVVQAVELTGLTQYLNESIEALSGGERQRVFLARALAQEPEILLLDEPTNHLDIHHQMRLFDSLRTWVKEKGLTVIAIFHDLNMASLYCDRLLILKAGKAVTVDEPAKALVEEPLKQVYQTELIRVEHPKVPSPLIALSPTKKIKENDFISSFTVEQSKEHLIIKSPTTFKTLSSAVINPGFGWCNSFINRHVDKNYNAKNPVEDLYQYISKMNMAPSRTIGMMTAACLEDVVFRQIDNRGSSIFVMVTAGLSNAVDATKGYLHDEVLHPIGTINCWVWVDRNLSDAAFVQAMMTAVEAKTRAVHNNHILDPVTGTPATGTSTDSLLIAATQTGPRIDYAGSITSLGKQIGRTIFEATDEAIKKNIIRRKEMQW